MAAEVRIEPIHSGPPKPLKRAFRVHGPVTRILVEIVHVHVERKTQLPQIALARGGLGRILCLRHRRQQKRRQNRNDSNDDKQLDERESLIAA